MVRGCDLSNSAIFNDKKRFINLALYELFIIGILIMPC